LILWEGVTHLVMIPNRKEKQYNIDKLYQISR
jgi:hypothetical protein